jgi:hypothetical protein
MESLWVHCSEFLDRATASIVALEGWRKFVVLWKNFTCPD